MKGLIGAACSVLLLAGCPVGTQVATGDTYFQARGFKVKIPAGYPVATTTPDDNTFSVRLNGAAPWISVERKSNYSVSNWLATAKAHAGAISIAGDFDGESGFYYAYEEHDTSFFMGGVDHRGNAYELFCYGPIDAAQKAKLGADTAELVRSWRWTD